MTTANSDDVFRALQDAGVLPAELQGVRSVVIALEPRKLATVTVTITGDADAMANALRAHLDGLQVMAVSQGGPAAEFGDGGGHDAGQ